MITNSPGTTAYPVSSFTWLLIPAQIQDAAKRDAIKDFLKWMLTEGQEYNEGLTYAQLPKPVIEKELKAIAHDPIIMSAAATAITREVPPKSGLALVFIDGERRR